MNQKTLLIAIAVAWAGTLFGAYLVGKSSGEDTQAAASSAGREESEGRSGGRLSALNGAKAKGDSRDAQSDRSAKPKGSSDALLMLKSSLASTNPVERMASFMQALALMDKDDFQQALVELEDDVRSGDNQREIGLLMYAWAEKDGASALGYLENLELGREGWSLYSSALTAWGGSNAEEAVDWALKKHEGKDGNDNWHMLGVINGVVKNDVMQAAQLAEEIGFGRARGEALGTIVDELFKQGDEAAMSWIESMGGEDERFRAGAAGRVASEIARKDPEAASKWVMGLDIEEKDRAVESVASQWGREAPEDAVEWASNLDDPDLRSQGTASVIGSWARRDADAAGTWLGERPASPELDGPVRTYAFMVQRRDPEAAVTWANTITDEKMRGETMERIGGEWARRSPEEAKAFFQTQENLPDGLQRFIR